MIEQPSTFLAMPMCNLGEVYYDFFALLGSLGLRRRGPICSPCHATFGDADDDLIQRVGVIKVEEQISLADAVA